MSAAWLPQGARSPLHGRPKAGRLPWPTSPLRARGKALPPQGAGLESDQ
jgi:hypothetical protein